MLESFLRPALALVNARELNIPAQRQRYALFVYGAAGALAASRDLGETEALALLVMLLRGGPGPRIGEREVSHLVGQAMAEAAEPSGRPVLEAGAEAMAQWLAGNAGTAVGGLARALRPAP
jgi:hypothetical protein